MDNKKKDPQHRWHKCTECNFKNKLAINLKYHMNSHTRNERVKCPLCSFSGKSKFYVARHLKLHHLNLADAMPSHPEYLQEINYAIQHLLEINEINEIKSIDGSNDRPLSNSQELENEEVDQSECEFIYQKVHNQDKNQEFSCTLCHYSSNIKFDVTLHMNRGHQYSASSCIQENHNIESLPESYLHTKGMRPSEFELVDLCDDEDMPMVNNPETNLLEQQKSIKLEERKVEIEEAECRKKIGQCKEDIRLARISMTEMREKIKNLKEIRSEKTKQKEILSHCLELVLINNQKLTDLSIESKKLEDIRSRIKDTNTKKLQSELQLRTLQLEELKSKRNLYEREFAIVIIKSNDEAIKNFKSHIKGKKNELECLRGEERVLARDVELLNQRLQVVVKIPDQVIQGLQLEIEELGKEIETSLQDGTEDVFNQLINSTEEKIRNLFELKNNLLDIMFVKKSIRSINTDEFMHCNF